MTVHVSLAFGSGVLLVCLSATVVTYEQEHKSRCLSPECPLSGFGGGKSKPINQDRDAEN
jgi:hypothetical protein